MEHTTGGHTQRFINGDFSIFSQFIILAYGFVTVRFIFRFQKVNDLKLLNISGHSVSSLTEDGLPSVLHNSLERLHLPNGNISSVHQETFKSFKKLKVLDLQGNKIAQLQRNQFKGLRELDMLDLSFNRIGKIDASHFADATKMSYLNLSHNALTDVPR